MTAQDVTGLVGALGFPIVLLLGLLWFVKRDVWPWVMKRIEVLDAVQAQRHQDFISAINRNGVANESMSKMLVVIDAEIRSNHAETGRELATIKAAVMGMAGLDYVEEKK